MKFIIFVSAILMASGAYAAPKFDPTGTYCHQEFRPYPGRSDTRTIYLQNFDSSKNQGNAVYKTAYPKYGVAPCGTGSHSNSGTFTLDRKTQSIRIYIRGVCDSKGKYTVDSKTNKVTSFLIVDDCSAGGPYHRVKVN